MTSTETKTPLALFKDRVRQEVVALVAIQPLGFCFEDIAARLGPTCATGGPDERSLRRQLQALCDQGVLYRVDWGIFVEGPEFAKIAGRDGIESALWRSFYSLGGVATLEDLKADMPLGTDDRKIRAVIRGTDRYFKGLPLPGWKNHYFVRDEWRERIPLPGNLQALESMILRLRQGKHIDQETALQRLWMFQRRVGACLREARMISGLTPDEIVNRSEVANALDVRLTACVTRPEEADLAERYGTVGGWWADRVRTDGGERAMLEAWGRIEGGEGARPTLQGALDVACWDAIGAVLALDAGLLSRGALRNRGQGLTPIP